MRVSSWCAIVSLFSVAQYEVAEKFSAVYIINQQHNMGLQSCHIIATVPNIHNYWYIEIVENQTLIAIIHIKPAI